MAIQVIRRWDPTPGSGLPRSDRSGCDYKSYVPDLLAGRTFLLEGRVAADVADAEAAIQRLNLEAAALVNSEAVARLLLRAEAVASSRIEGLEAGGRRLLRAEAARALGDPVGDVTAEEILGNITAMAWAIEALAEVPKIELEHLLEVHRRLLADTRLHDHAGVIRASQNWIGGSDYNPCRAAFVPPPPEQVVSLLRDLVDFCNGDDLSPVVQAARRARPVRDHPSLCRRQWPNRAGPDSRHPAKAGPGLACADPGLTGTGDQVQGTISTG